MKNEIDKVIDGYIQDLITWKELQDLLRGIDRKDSYFIRKLI